MCWHVPLDIEKWLWCFTMWSLPSLLWCRIGVLNCGEECVPKHDSTRLVWIIRHGNFRLFIEIGDGYWKTWMNDQNLGCGHVFVAPYGTYVVCCSLICVLHQLQYSPLHCESAGVMQDFSFICQPRRLATEMHLACQYWFVPSCSCCWYCQFM